MRIRECDVGLCNNSPDVLAEHNHLVFGMFVGTELLLVSGVFGPIKRLFRAPDKMVGGVLGVAQTALCGVVFYTAGFRICG